MGEDYTFIANIKTSKQQAHSLLDLPNPDTDNTGSLTPHKLHTTDGSHHNNIGMDTCNITGTHTSIENSTIKLSTNYYQTCTAQRAHHTQETYNVDTGTTTQKQQSVYSNFDTEHNIKKLYLASRNNTNNNVHQNLACTFDPSDKTCTVCTTPHNILSQTQQAPLTFIISDQGFRGILSGGDALCVKTVWIKDGTVAELSNLFLEMFQNVVLPNSTIVLLGSLTNMLQQGSSGYLFDWLACAKKLGGRWGNIKVCPLPPLWDGVLPGKMHRTLLEIEAALGHCTGGSMRFAVSMGRACL